MKTRKDFLQVGKILKDLKENCQADILKIYNENYKAEFSKNPRFDEKRFFQFCGI